ncbi:MAG: aminotransferase class V-fold PLP-dependent enzyme [Lachnospiraceae bacterium]|nr:MAG: aminotransferase class V-fold PLP-dependent enzyme [Lachnospiraceae bacterium]
MELLDKLKELKQDDPYPMHMPGHKRIRLDFPNIYDIDITETDGYDNLHRPEGIIKELSRETAELYGADQAFLSVGGSTDMILTSIFAATRPEDKIIIARNCHKSVYHAAVLRDLQVRYLFPEILELGIPGGIKPSEVNKLLKSEKYISACVVTSPTYEGVISDVRSIADICHEYGIPLIVDAAHGAHLGFGNFPVNPIKQGADAVVISLHKTLPSLTQTACLLRNKDSLISAERIRKYFDYFETSSPSYVLMAGIDNCITFLKEKGPAAFENYEKKLKSLRENLKKLKNISLFEPENYSYDPSKLVISMYGKSGTELADILRRGKIEPEMTSLSYCLAMTSVMDTDQGFERLFRVLQAASKSETDYGKRLINSVVPQKSHENSLNRASGIYQQAPEKRYDIGIAEKSEIIYQEKDKLEGKVSGGIVTVYPPGIPLIVPGEIFTDKVLVDLKTAKAAGLTVDGDFNGKYLIVKEK